MGRTASETLLGDSGDLPCHLACYCPRLMTELTPFLLSFFFFFFFFQARWPFVDFETESQGKHLSCSNSSKTIINRSASSYARLLTKEDSGE